MGTGILQVGKENDWRAVAANYHMMAALKSDGSLWQWKFNMNDQEQFIRAAQQSADTAGHPQRLGRDCGQLGRVIALAADGSLWLWPDIKYDDNSFC